MQQSEIQKFWNEVGSTKDFTDPFFADKFSALVKKESVIVEYGCGYGRVLNHLAHLGFQNLQGFDFAPKMIARGQKMFPHLQLAIMKSAALPLAPGSIDAAILSTVLCCNPYREEQHQIVREIHRILKPGGIIYLCDFLITPTAKYLTRYAQQAAINSDDYGIYLTTEGILVKHYTIKQIVTLLSDLIFSGWSN